MNSHLSASFLSECSSRCAAGTSRDRDESISPNWIVLVLAGLCECGFAFCLGKANLASGGRQIIWYAVFVVLYALSMILLAKAVKTIPIGTAYPVWTGIGAVGTVLLASTWRKS